MFFISFLVFFMMNWFFYDDFLSIPMVPPFIVVHIFTLTPSQCNLICSLTPSQCCHPSPLTSSQCFWFQFTPCFVDTYNTNFFSCFGFIMEFYSGLIPLASHIFIMIGKFVVLLSSIWFIWNQNFFQFGIFNFTQHQLFGVYFICCLNWKF